MKETVFGLVTRLILANLAAGLAFAGMYYLGASQGITMIQEYYIIPLVILSLVLIYENYKEIKICKMQNC